MKKIYKIILISLISCFLFSFTVSAAEQEDYFMLQGVYVFNNSLPDITFQPDIDISFPFYDGDANLWSGVYYSSYEDILYFYLGDYYQYVYDISLGWSSPEYQTIRFYHDMTYSIESDFNTYNVFQYLKANSTELLCNGESCPIGDENGDGYCEDCGRLFALDRPEENPNPVYPSDLPVLPNEVSTGDWEHIVMNVDGVIKLYSYYVGNDKSYYAWGNSNNDTVHLESQASYNTGNAYNLVNGNWEYSGILSGDYNLGERKDIIYSSTIIYDENGEYFFPLTLWAQILKVVQGAMKKMIPQMDSSVSFLVLCGIGCLALLIGLVVLLKVLRKFLH